MRLPVTFYNSKQYGTLVGEPFPLGRPTFATGREYSEVISKVKQYYNVLVKKVIEEGLVEGLDWFLRQISPFAIPDASFKKCLATELGISINEVDRALLTTSYIVERFDTLKSNYRKVRRNSLEYAESVGELVSLFGIQKVKDMMRRYNLELSDSLLNYLYKVSMMPVSVKRLIKEGKINLTNAFELPIERAEEIAEKIAGLKFNEARKILKRLKEE
jgi:hypothetical protein